MLYMFCYYFLMPVLCRAESTKIFVGGLSPDVGDKEFKEYFEKFGEVTVSIFCVNSTMVDEKIYLGFYCDV